MVLMLSLMGCEQRHSTASPQAAQPAAIGPQEPASATGASATPTLADWETIPRTPLHPHAQQQSIRDALLTHQHPERLSLQQPSTVFVLASYRSHPEAYLEVIEPGRVFAPARCAPGVAQLTVVGGTHRTVPSGATIALSAQVAPRAPLTVTTVDGGVFENGLSTITIQADDTGLGTVHFTATAGTVAEVRILAASPMSSGQGHWVLGVTAAPAPAPASSSSSSSAPAPASSHP